MAVMPMSDGESRKPPRRWKGVDPARSRTMSLVRGKDTAPEMTVRRLVHRMGYRYGLHCRDLPGKPDMVFRSRKKIIFVHGCFWHGHNAPSCRRARVPKTRREFWSAKIERNGKRDAMTEQTLREAGWKVLIIWECETSSRAQDILVKRIISFLGQRSKRPGRQQVRR